MAEKEFNNYNAPTGQVQKNVPRGPEKKQSRALWIVFLVFFGLVAAVFLFQGRESFINWVEHYEAGIQLAKRQNKPILLAFFKQHTRFCSDMQQNTYNNPDVIEYVEQNFVPILIDVDKQPEIAKRYRVSYYPTHYIKRPDSDELFGPRLGYDPPSLFIKELKYLVEKMEARSKSLSQ